MEARTATAILFATLMITMPAATAGTADDPNVEDPAQDETDPLTKGLTPLAPQLDLRAGWIQPTDDTVDFTIEIEDATIPHTLRPAVGGTSEIWYEFRFSVDEAVFDGTKCAGANGGIVAARTTYGTLARAPTTDDTDDPPAPSTDKMEARVACVDLPKWNPAEERFGGEDAHFYEYRTSAMVDGAQITVPADRVVDENVFPFLSPGTTLQDPQLVVYREALSAFGGQVYDTAGPGTSQLV